jgi:sugar O-acyltransferase (sialic acid O-acetyltransferase NeuD family)
MTATDRLVVVGAGGHGRETVLVAKAAGWQVVGVIAENPPEAGLLERLGVAWLGGEHGAQSGEVAEAIRAADAQYVLGIGDPAARRRLDEVLGDSGCEPATVVHPLAVLGGDLRLAPGVIVAGGAHLTTNVSLGRHSHVNVGGIVSHDCEIGDYVSLSPAVAVNGNVVLGDEVFLGAGAVVTPGCTIGESAVIGAGAVVTGDVPPGVTAVGVPARW